MAASPPRSPSKPHDAAQPEVRMPADVGGGRLVADPPGEIGSHAVAAGLAEPHADTRAPERALVRQQCTVRIDVDRGLFPKALDVRAIDEARQGQVAAEGL